MRGGRAPRLAAIAAAGLCVQLCSAAPCPVADLRVQQLPQGALGGGTIAVAAACPAGTAVPEGSTCAVEFPNDAACDTSTCQADGAWSPQDVTCAPSYWAYDGLIEFTGALPKADATAVADDLKALVLEKVAGETCPCEAGYIQIIVGASAGEYKARVVLPVEDVTEHQLRAKLQAAWAAVYADAGGDLRAKFKVTSDVPAVSMVSDPRASPPPGTPVRPGDAGGGGAQGGGGGDGGGAGNGGGGDGASRASAKEDDDGSNDLEMILLVLAIVLGILLLLACAYLYHTATKKKKKQDRELFDVDPYFGSSMQSLRSPSAQPPRPSLMDLSGGEMFAGTPRQQPMSHPTLSQGLVPTDVSRRPSATAVPMDDGDEAWTAPKSPRVGLNKQQAANLKAPQHASIVAKVNADAPAPSGLIRLSGD